MTNIAEAYKRTEAIWPKDLPPATAEELTKAAKRLYRSILGSPQYGSVEVRVAHGLGRNYPYMDGNTILANPSLGWDHNVHGWSHAFHRRLHVRAGNSTKSGPGKPHSKDHARLEARMIRMVLKRGWLGGSLKSKPVAPKPKPTKDEARAAKLARIEERIARWEAKQKRATTALKKLNRQKRGLERSMA